MDAPKQKHATKNSFIKTEPTLSEESSANSAPDEKNLSCSDRAEESNQSPDPDRLGDAAGDKFAVVLVGVTGQRRSRSKVLRNKIKVENIAEGLIACPHPICKKEKIGIVLGENGCNVITCTNHSPFFHFCVHCKEEVANGEIAMCSCRKRGDRLTRLSEQNRRNDECRSNPIVLFCTDGGN